MAFTQRSTIYALEELGKLYRTREQAKIGGQLSNGEISGEEAIKRLQALPATNEGELFVNLGKIMRSWRKYAST